MTLILEKVENAEVYIFKGGDRATAESVIEKGDRLYPGNPLRITHKEDLLIVFRKSVTGVVASSNFSPLPGSFTLSYEVIGTKHAWWKLPFIDEHEAYWYASLSVTCLVLVCCPIAFIYFLIVRPCKK